MRRTLPIAIAAAALLAGCATPLQPGGPPTLPEYGVPVVGDATVLQRDGEAPQLCLGAVAESYPIQCGGPEIVGWEWTDGDLHESAGGVTWGSYHVFGTWFGDRFESTNPPIPLALYDPTAPEPDPRLDPATPGKLRADEIEGIQDYLAAERESLGYLGSYDSNGYLWVEVYYDAGDIQHLLDAGFGSGRIAVISALKPFPEG